MSPRRRIPAGRPPLFSELAVPAPGRWRRRLLVAQLVLIVSAAIYICALSLLNHESDRRTAIREVAALTDVRSFMELFTSPDPFHANDYVDRVLARATGEFASQYQEKVNLTLARIARSQPAKGTVLDAGIERWNDDGSAMVLVATEVRSSSADGKSTEDVPYRWIVTAEKEGSEWKISGLVQVL